MTPYLKLGFKVRASCLLLVFAFGILFVSCEEFLEDVDPSAALPVEDEISTLEDLDLLLLGAYQSLIDLAGDQLWVVLPDLTTEDVTVLSGSCGQTQDYDLNTLTAGNNLLHDMWFRAYRTINQANVVLDNVGPLEMASIITAEDAQRLAGEARFLRAFVNFQLVRLFAKPYNEANASALAVPLRLSGITMGSELEYLPRATVAEVYEQIQIDFEESFALLPGAFVSGRANPWASLAFLAEVAFQMGDYEEALRYTQEIIDANIFALANPPETYFERAGTTEEIWAITHTAQEGNDLFALTQGISCNSVKLSDDLYERAFDPIISDEQKDDLNANNWKAVDLRYINLTNSNPQDWRTLKYKSQDRSDDVPAMRYAEVLLIHAECLARVSDDIANAVQYLNMIRGRSLEVYDDDGSLISDDTILFSPDDFASKEELIEAIILERQVELLLEGNRFHDLMRLKRSVNGIPYDDCRLRWPIPQVEVDANPNISQDYPTEC